MNKFEELEQEACENNINIDTFAFDSNLKGLYVDGNIAIDTSLKNDIERSCILAEELGHHYTTVGNILNQEKSSNRKQELKARLYAYNKLIGLLGIVKCFESGCKNIHEMADELNITEEFLSEALELYETKYSPGIKIDNYYVQFTPNLGVFRLI
ncbi:MAG: hypothetical protein PHT76_14910 [Anaerostipes sp.]|nr:hypothetical protein [Anaerostipes sp.]